MLAHRVTAFGLLLSGLGSGACAGSGQRTCTPPAAHATAPHHHDETSSAKGPPPPSAAHHHHEASSSRDAPAPSTPQPEKRTIVIPHSQLKSFENNGNSLMGVATKGLGSERFEVWRSKVLPGSQTPPHVHETEEIFIFLEGKGRATIGHQSFEFEAPATVIAPARVQHQFFNTGSVPTDAIVIVGIGSAIHDTSGKRMDLPWRK